MVRKKVKKKVKKKTTRAKIKIVKVAILGENVREMAVSPKATVSDVLKQAGVNEVEDGVRVNNVETNLNSIVANNALLTVVPKINGGY